MAAASLACMRFLNRYVDSTTIIRADALDNGSGGGHYGLVGWPDHRAGHLHRARGGPNGGNGGTIETSGQVLSVNTASPSTPRRRTAIPAPGCSTRPTSSSTLPRSPRRGDRRRAGKRHQRHIADYGERQSDDAVRADHKRNQYVRHRRHRHQWSALTWGTNAVLDAQRVQFDCRQRLPITIGGGGSLALNATNAIAVNALGHGQRRGRSESCCWLRHDDGAGCLAA